VDTYLRLPYRAMRIVPSPRPNRPVLLPASRPRFREAEERPLPRSRGATLAGA
jgi:hypothetical protein